MIAFQRRLNGELSISILAANGQEQNLEHQMIIYFGMLLDHQWP